MKNNIEAKRMRADIIKTMTKEELETFRQDVHRSKLRTDSTSGYSTTEMVISQKANQL